MDIDCAAQVAFIFGGFLGQNVAFKGLTAFDSSTRTNAKAFFRAAFGLHFGHFHAPYGFVAHARRLGDWSLALVAPDELRFCAFDGMKATHMAKTDLPLSAEL
jgi:hypothetical protein